MVGYGLEVSGYGRVWVQILLLVHISRRRLSQRMNEVEPQGRIARQSIRCMQPTVTDVFYGLCGTETAELVEFMLFGMWTRVGRRNHVYKMGEGVWIPTKTGTFRGSYLGMHRPASRRHS